MMPNILPKQNVLSSDILGNRRVGNMRSPLFKVEYDQILIRANAKKIFMRVVIDNYHMGKYSGLLFGGTVIKEANSEVILNGLVYHPKNIRDIGLIQNCR